ncbi:MAG: sulfatase-like hydrolase/transferase [Candidatus Coatesbacteria bacterium]|nr:MAG: sulfatase-like hydrolase/transferase [Candidatus Coatesbacteria bacterium]
MFKELLKKLISGAAFVAAAAFFWGGSEALLNRLSPPRYTWQPDRLLESAYGREIFYAVVLLVITGAAGAVPALARRRRQRGSRGEEGRWRGAAATAAVTASGAGWFVLSRIRRGTVDLGFIQADLFKPLAFFFFWAVFAVLGGGLAFLLGRHLTRQRWWRRAARYALAAGAVGFVAVAAARHAERAWRPVPPGPDVVLVILDAWRYDAFRESLTPNLWAYAAESGHVYTRAWAPAPWTVPSMGSIFTGQFFDTHRARSGPRADAVSPTIAQAFRAAGYETAAVVGNRLLDRHHPLTDGFDDYVNWCWPPLLQRICFFHTNWYGPAVRGLIQRPLGADVSPRLTAMFGRHLARERRRPLFLWVHYMDPHGPYLPPAGYALPRDEALKGQPLTHHKKRIYAHHRLYEAECRFVDDLLGPLVLPTLAASRDAVVIITSDHGEEFLEHGTLEHGKSVYETATRVPLIISIPGEGAAVSDAPVSLVDLGPTLLDLAGIPLLPAMQGQPLTLGREERPPRPIFVGSNFTYPESDPHPRKAALVAWPLKLILEHEDMTKPGEYYNLALDPGETRPLPEDETASLLRSRLQEWKRTTRRRKMPDLSPMDTAAPADLRALGYVQ